MRYNLVACSHYDIKKEGLKPIITDYSKEKSIKLVFQTEIPTPEQYNFVTESYNRFNLETLFNELLSHFNKKYNKNCSNKIKFLHTYTKSMDVFLDDMGEPFIFIDGLVSTSLLETIGIIFLWSKYDQDKDVGSFCLQYLLFIFNEKCRNGQLSDEASQDMWRDKFNDDLHILTLASDVHWVCLAFALSHELAHFYQEYQSDFNDCISLYNREFEADKIAYEIVIDLILEQKSKENEVSWPVYYEYTYLSPLMLLDFYDLLYYTDLLLHGEKYDDHTHPSISERKDRLLAVVDLPEYEFNTEEGNDLYNCYLDICDLYKEKIKSIKDHDLFENIIGALINHE